MNLKHILFFLSMTICLTPYVSSSGALIMGFTLSYLGAVPNQVPTSKITKVLLTYSIIGLGFGIQFQEALAATSDNIGLIVITIFSTLFIGYFIAQKIGLNSKSSYLISVGTSICGGSAIAAVSPAIKASNTQTGLALAVVFVLNSAALLTFPLVGHLLELDQHTFGTWAAIAIHDTSSVIGATSAYGEEALKTATTLKLARALWIMPIAFISALLFKSKSRKITTPFFILFYCAAILVSDYLPQFEALYNGIFSIAKQTLVVCLFLIGSSLSIEKLKSAGAKPLLFGGLLWGMISFFSLTWLIMRL